MRGGAHATFNWIETAALSGKSYKIIKDGTDGILVEPDNPNALAKALLNVLQNRPLRLSIANNGYMTVIKKFSSEKTGSSYEALFADLVTATRL